MSNWETQIAEHSGGTLSCIRYHGAARSKLKTSELGSSHVVLTTYGVVASDKLLLKRVRWPPLPYSVEWRDNAVSIHAQWLPAWLRGTEGLIESETRVATMLWFTAFRAAIWMNNEHYSMIPCRCYWQDNALCLSGQYPIRFFCFQVQKNAVFWVLNMHVACKAAAAEQEKGNLRLSLSVWCVWAMVMLQHAANDRALHVAHHEDKILSGLAFKPHVSYTHAFVLDLRGQQLTCDALVPPEAAQKFSLLACI
jgi:hypothetical protein